MEEKLVELLDRLLQTAGIDPMTGLIVLVAVAAALALVRGLHTLAQGLHTRRKEFVEMFEKLSTANADPLALEAAIRHGFGVWLPATAIQRIRGQPFASRCLRSLSDLEPFLEPDAAAGTFAIKSDFADPTTRKIHVVVRYIVYFFCSLAAAVSFGLLGGFSPHLPIAVQVVFGVVFVVIGVWSLDVAVELGRLTDFMRRYPTLVTIDANAATDLPSPLRPNAPRRLARAWHWLAQRWRGRRHTGERSARDSSTAGSGNVELPDTARHVEALPPDGVADAAARKSLSDSDASTPRA